jgi:hypothetical protein
MLRDRRNLLGREREGGPVGLRTAARGEPLVRDMALAPRLNDLGFDPKSDPLEPGRRSWGGEAVKHSSRVSVESAPAPNLKGGIGLLCSCCLKDTVLVE